MTDRALQQTSNCVQERKSSAWWKRFDVWERHFCCRTARVVLAWGKEVFQEVVPCVSCFCVRAMLRFSPGMRTQEVVTKPPWFGALQPWLSFSTGELDCRKTSMEFDSAICGEMFQLWLFPCHQTNKVQSLGKKVAWIAFGKPNCRFLMAKLTFPSTH